MIIDRKKLAIILAVVLLLVVGISQLAGGQDSEDPISVTNSGSATSRNKDNLDSTIDRKLTDNKKEANFFSEYRLERERMRGRQLEMLKEIIKTENTEKVAREAASLRMVEVTKDMEKELKAESLVKSKGFSDCVVIFQPEATTVVVQADNIPLDKEKEIKELVSRITQSNQDKISIIVREPE